jgi:hypothetical protein
VKKAVAADMNGMTTCATILAKDNIWAFSVGTLNTKIIKKRIGQGKSWRSGSTA